MWVLVQYYIKLYSPIAASGFEYYWRPVLLTWYSCLCTYPARSQVYTFKCSWTNNITLCKIIFTCIQNAILTHEKSKSKGVLVAIVSYCQMLWLFWTKSWLFCHGQVKIYFGLQIHWTFVWTQCLIVDNVILLMVPVRLYWTDIFVTVLLY